MTSGEAQLGGSGGVAGAGAPRPAALRYRIRPVLVTAIVGWIIFSGFRAALLLVSYQAIGDLSAWQIVQCLLIGLRYDAMPIGYAILPMVLAMFLSPDRRLARGALLRLVTVYATALVLAAVLVEVVGAPFFTQFHYRLNWVALSYPRHIREIAWYVSTNYPVLLVPPAAVVLWHAAYRFFHGMFWRGPAPRGGTPLRLAAGAVLTALCVVACRGGFGSRPLRFEAAGYTDNRIVNELAMNNFFTFFYAVKSTAENSEEAPRLHRMPPLEQAQAAACAMLMQPGDTALGSRRNPLWRRTDTHRPAMKYNVVVIIMEGMSGQPVGAQGYSPSYTPQLDALCREGLFFDRMYAVGERTSRAMVGVLCGHPDMETQSVLERPAAEGRFFTLPQVFRQRGYQTLFLYGGDPDFDNMRRFFLHGGIREIVSEDQMHAEELAGNWGVPDEVIFREAAARLRQMGDEPFFAVILTVSNHKPYKVPSGRVPMLVGDDIVTRKLNSYRYADWALGEFFRMARESAYFRHTIFVLVADHGHDLSSSRIMDVPGHRIPCVFYAPGLVPPQRNSVVASQTDIPPTLLALLGGSYEHCFLGRDLRRVRPDDGFAMMQENSNLAFARTDHAVVEPPDSPTAMIFDIDAFTMTNITAQKEHEALRADMQTQMLGYYETARQLFYQGAYGRPSDSGEPKTPEDGKED